MTIEDIAYVTSEKSGYEHCIRFIAECSINNDGIGAYEFWGSRGYDKGTAYITVDSVECYMVRNGKERRIITNDAIDKEVDRIVSNKELEPDYPEPDDAY